MRGLRRRVVLGIDRGCLVHSVRGRHVSGHCRADHVRVVRRGQVQRRGRGIVHGVRQGLVRRYEWHGDLRRLCGGLHRLLHRPERVHVVQREQLRYGHGQQRVHCLRRGQDLVCWRGSVCELWRGQVRQLGRIELCGLRRRVVLGSGSRVVHSVRGRHVSGLCRAGVVCVMRRGHVQRRGRGIMQQLFAGLLFC